MPPASPISAGRWRRTHGFDPHEDLKRNSFGVLEFATNKPELRHDFALYLHVRDEDVAFSA